MGLDRAKLTDRTSSLGIGGNTEGHEAFAFIMLQDEETRKVHVFRTRVFVPDEDSEMVEIDASVLGRDALDHVVLTIDGPNRVVTIDVTDCDETHVLRKPM
jgi:hypothetical protein